MRIAIVSDIHSNLEALDAVRAAMDREGAEAAYFVGDAVGYGPDPLGCTRWVLECAELAVVGNHDHAAVGLADRTAFNNHARAAIDWTEGVMEGWASDFLRSLPLAATRGEVTLAHASPREPGRWDYILTLWDAEANFGHFEGTFCFVGHSHQPVSVARGPDGQVSVLPGDSFTAQPGWRYLVNVGSVGQPRDGNPAACFGMVDTDRGRFHLVRAPYDVQATQRKMERAGLPRPLAARLSAGR